MGTSPCPDKTLTDMPRTNKKPLSLDQLPSWIENPDFVSDATLQQFKNLMGTTAQLNREYPGGWGDDEVRAFIVKTRRQTLSLTALRYEKEREVSIGHEEEGKKIVDGYLRHFSKPSPNDMVNLTEMARIQLTLQLLDQRMKELTLETKPRADDIKTLNTVRKDAIKSFQELEKSLGIDRETRQEESDTVSIVAQIRAQAAELLEKRRRQIVCRNCAEDGVVINLGFVVFHMDQNNVMWKFETFCPRCQKVIYIDRGMPNF